MIFNRQEDEKVMQKIFLFPVSLSSTNIHISISSIHRKSNKIILSATRICFSKPGNPARFLGEIPFRHGTRQTVVSIRDPTKLSRIRDLQVQGPFIQVASTGGYRAIFVELQDPRVSACNQRYLEALCVAQPVENRIDPWKIVRYWVKPRVFTRLVLTRHCVTLAILTVSIWNQVKVKDRIIRFLTPMKLYDRALDETESFGFMQLHRDQHFIIL